MNIFSILAITLKTAVDRAKAQSSLRKNKDLGRKGLFETNSSDLEEEYRLTREMLAARSKFGLTQEAVAEFMGTTKSAVSRLEAAGKHAPSLTTLKKYARAVGCRLEIKL